MTTTHGIAITFPDGTEHIVRATPEQMDDYRASLDRGFSALAHDGLHDHDQFMGAAIKPCEFDPATVRAEVWPDVISYMKDKHDLDVDPEQDGADAYFDSFTFELMPATEPFNAVNARLEPGGSWQAGCHPVLTFVVQRDARTGGLMPFDGVDALIPGDLTDAHTAHRPTPECSHVWSSEPACARAAEHLRWVVEAKAKQQAEKGANA